MATDTKQSKPTTKPQRIVRKPPLGTTAAGTVIDSSADVAGSSPSVSTPPAVSRFQSFTTRTVHRSLLHGAPYNPRTIDKHAKKKLREILRSHGLVEPLIVNERDGRLTLVGGHQRLDCLDALEGTQDYYLTVSVISVPVSVEKELNIALNNPGLQGTWDIDLLEQIMSDPDVRPLATGFERADLGLLFDQGALDCLFGTPNSPAAQQEATEADTVAMLAEMKQAGLEVDRAERAKKKERERQSGGGQDSDSEGDGLATDADAADDADADHSLFGDSPPAAPSDLASDDPAAAAAAHRQLLIDRRNAYIARSQDANDTDFMLVVTAESSLQLDQFLQRTGLPLDEKFISLQQLADAVGVSLE